MKRIKPVSEYQNLSSLECALKCAEASKLGKNVFFNEKVRKELRFWKFKDKHIIHLENGKYVYVENDTYYSYYDYDNIKVVAYYKVK